MTTWLRVCPECRRHVGIEETACPFCASALRPVPPTPEQARIERHVSRARVLAAGAIALGFLEYCGTPQLAYAPVPLRGPGEACEMDWECASDVCTDHRCQAPTCADEVWNGEEDGVDCGGSECGGCTDDTCTNDSECANGWCAQSRCVAPECANGRGDEFETDIDCGGWRCPRCELGQQCRSDEDCVGGFCSELLCSDERCRDNVLNLDETDVDCGGDVCPGCAPGHDCALDSDCTPGGHCVSGTCQVTACGADTPCPGGSGCVEEICRDTDCELDTDCWDHARCVEGTCRDLFCADGLWSWEETDTDCGGPLCEPCQVGGACIADQDCTSGLCADGVCLPHAP